MRLSEPGNLLNWLPPLPKSNEDLYKITRTNITPRPIAKTTNAQDYQAARKAIAARAKTKSKPAAPKKTSAASSSGGSLSGGFGGSSPSSFGGGSTGGSYLDIFKNTPQDDKTLADYMADANKIYKPSLDYLNQQKTDATKRAGVYDTNLQKMYSALVGDINAQQPVIANNYNNAINQQDQITNTSKQAVGNNFQNAQSQQMDMLRQLGVEAAAPDTLQTGQNSQAFFQSLLDSSGAGYDSFLNSQKVASQDFNTAQSNIANQTGVNARADLQMGLQDLLGQLAGKGADLQTQVNQQAVSMQSGAAQAMLEQQKAMLDAMYKQDQTNLGIGNLDLRGQQLALDRIKAANGDENAKARLELDAAKFEATPPKTAATPKLPSDPWGDASAIANSIYGNKTSAGSAIKAIQDAIRAKGKPNSADELLNTVLTRVSPTGRPTGGGDTANLQRLVDYLYGKLYG